MAGERPAPRDKSIEIEFRPTAGTTPAGTEVQGAGFVIKDEHVWDDDDPLLPFKVLAFIPAFLGVATVAIVLDARLQRYKDSQQNLKVQTTLGAVETQEALSGGQCTGNIVTMGELKIRIPGTDRLQAFVMPRCVEEPAK